MRKYIYKNHAGGLFYENKKLPEYMLYCSMCKDKDILLVVAEKPQDIYKALEGDIDIDGSGGYEKEYVDEFINSIKWSE